MSALFSAKNREFLLGPLSKNTQGYRTGPGYLFCPCCYCQAGACHRNGAFGNGRNRFLECDPFADAKYHSDPYPYHRTIGR